MAATFLVSSRRGTVAFATEIGSGSTRRFSGNFRVPEMRTLVLAAGLATKAVDWKQCGTELLLALHIIAMLLVAVWGLMLA